MVSFKTWLAAVLTALFHACHPTECVQIRYVPASDDFDRCCDDVCVSH